MEPIRRSLPDDITSGGGRLLRGFIPYNAPTRITERGRTYTEVIRRGAFAGALKGGRDVLSTFNHDISRLLGRTASGTLRLSDSAEGLRYEVDLPASAADVRELLARGDLRGSSFTALVLPGGERWTRDLREVVGLELVELGPVVSPAYPTSGADLRSARRPGRLGHHLAAALLRLMERT
ncbi:MAG: HK97 family phage prohead protease [Gemmataceae bacterium]|nr:HK97 family phage prohead protease [Gemmataceae bacterium]